ncbi:putative multidrug resistance protein NorM [Hyphomicrobiales bacterium]|nr:putative multidrug resistance protein NorM [Hyphomicrobiales bacterium]CAH1670157.1 putative multidrug resistance protein NorM [Hyphomicrobiales bacterium]
MAATADVAYNGGMSTTMPSRTAMWSAWRAEARAMAALGWPLILTNVAQTAMTTTDVIMMGRIGPQALAAGALAANLYFAVLIFCIGLVTATAPMVATELGRHRHSVLDVRRTVRQGFWSAAIIAVPAWAILWYGEAILLAFGQDRELAAAAGGYLRTLQWSILPFLLYLVLRSFVAALERPLWPLLIGLFAIVFNALANLCLMFGKFGFPALGLPGSGIATSLSSTLLFAGLAVVIVTDRRFRRYRLFGHWWRADWPRLIAFWRLGLPIAATITLEVTIFNAAAFLMGLLSSSELAAHAIAMQIASLAFMVPLGVGQAATVRVGRGYGAHDPDAIRRAGWMAFVICMSFMAVTASVMILLPQVLIGAFLDTADPANAQVIGFAVLFLAFAALFQAADGGQAVLIGMLRGLHDTRVPMLIAATGYWIIGLPLGAVLAFPLGWRGAGIWTGLATGLSVVAVLLMWRWLRRDRIGLVPTGGKSQTLLELAPAHP